MSIFGGTLDAVTVDPATGLPVPGVTVYAFDDDVAGTLLGSVLSDLGGGFALDLETELDTVWVSTSSTGTRYPVTARDALDRKANADDVAASLATKANAATVGALTTRVDTTETRVGTVEDELGGRLSEPVLSSTFALKGEGSSPLSRFAWKLDQGLDVKIVAIGDSILEGNTTTVPGTDDALSLITAELDAANAGTVTKSNRATSGYTAANTFISGRVASAIADAGDLYIIGFGHNDLRSDYRTPGTGYPKAAMVRSIEKIIRRIRDEVPGADIVLMLENPYTPVANTSNPYLVAQNDLLRPLAAFYGCALADTYQPFIDLGDFSSLMADTGHPNTAGHRLMADTIKALIPDSGQSLPPAIPSGDLYGAARVSRSWESYTANQAAAAPTQGGRYVVSGAGWSSTTTAPHTSSTVGNSVRVISFGDEALLRLDCGAGQGTVTIDVDSALSAYTIDLSTYDNGQRTLPITGLGPGPHSLVIKVASGSVTFRGLDVRARQGTSYSISPTDTAKVVRTGTWTENTALGTSSPSGASISSTVLGDSIAVTFFGTGLVMAHNRYTTSHTFDVAVDGGAASSLTVNAAAAGGVWGPSQIVSGLPLGKHTVSIKSTGARNAFTVYDLTAIDETTTGYRRDVDLSSALRSASGA